MGDDRKAAAIIHAGPGIFSITWIGNVEYPIRVSVASKAVALCERSNADGRVVIEVVYHTAESFAEQLEREEIARYFYSEPGAFMEGLTKEAENAQDF